MLVSAPKYTSRIQKGGALIPEMRQLVRLWTNAPTDENKDAILRSNPLGKTTRSRLADVLNRIFVPRFVHGAIPCAWKVLRTLEEAGASSATLRPIYYWFTARSEPLLSDFVTEYLVPRRATGLRAVGVPEFISWLGTKDMGWSEIVGIKSGRAILAALRDFGVLDGKAKKTLVRPPLPLGAFSFIAFCLSRLGVAGRDMLEHPDWTLFMLTPSDVEHLFLEAHQERLLGYHAAGTLVNLDFPVGSAEEYAHVVVRK
jgi:Putative inner membrane protein (DUF1819)